MTELPPLQGRKRKLRKRMTHVLAGPGRGRVKNPKHMAWVRKHECVLLVARYLSNFPVVCDGRIHAHHVTTRGAGGGDDQVVSICAFHHHQIHTLGRETFESRYRINLDALAAAFAERSPFVRKAKA